MHRFQAIVFVATMVMKSISTKSAALFPETFFSYAWGLCGIKTICGASKVETTVSHQPANKDVLR
jgi:hypothetical protein